MPQLHTNNIIYTLLLFLQFSDLKSSGPIPVLSSGDMYDSMPGEAGGKKKKQKYKISSAIVSYMHQ